jgi:hypothetical protein
MPYPIFATAAVLVYGRLCDVHRRQLDVSLDHSPEKTATLLKTYPR